MVSSKRSLDESPSGQPPAKQAKTEDKKHLKFIPPMEFLRNKLDYYQGPQVVIQVGDTNYHLPKRLMCYSSPFFDRAFNGGFKEGIEQKIHLQFVSTETFALVVYWVYFNELNLPESDTIKEYQDKLASLVDFLRYADEIDLLGPFDEIINSVKAILALSHYYLSPEHVRQGVELPESHPVRKLFAQSCVQSYTNDLLPAGQVKDRLLREHPETRFRFRKEFDELPGFSRDLTREYESLMRSRQLKALPCTSTTL